MTPDISNFKAISTQIISLFHHDENSSFTILISFIIPVIFNAYKENSLNKLLSFKFSYTSKSKLG